jgi:hypothetical protein
MGGTYSMSLPWLTKFTLSLYIAGILVPLLRLLLQLAARLGFWLCQFNIGPYDDG